VGVNDESTESANSKQPNMNAAVALGGDTRRTNVE
jgi:hypothetical protein